MDVPTTNLQIGRLLRSERIERASIEAIRHRRLSGTHAPRTASLHRAPRLQPPRLAA